MLYKALGLSLFFSALAVPVNAQLSEKDVTETWHRGAFTWENKKQFASYQFLGKGSEFAVGFIYPGSGSRWSMRVPSLTIIDCKSGEVLSGWIATDTTKEGLLEDHNEESKLVNQFVADFCTTHKTLFPAASIYKSIEM
tara:strand:- start:48 stop:464 length:417 start_codon:yes stop_codon:yes gene_type:complete